MREKLVVDTNVLISAALCPKGTCGETLREAYDEFQIVQSKETFQEISEKLMDDRFAKIEGREDFLKNLSDNSQFIEIIHETEICRDRDDNKFLELAVSSNAVTIVTGDKDLTDMEHYLGIDIEKPREFLDRQYDLGRSI